MTSFERPTIDWAALSPELILLGGAALCLIIALFLPWGWRPFCAAVAALSLVGAGAAAIVLFTMDEGTAEGIVSDALRRDRLAEFGQILIAARDSSPSGSASAGSATSGRAWGSTTRSSSPPPPAALLRRRLEPDDALPRSRVVLDLALHPLRRRGGAPAFARGRPEVPDRRELRLGDPPLRSAFVYGATGSLGFAEIAAGADEADRLFLVAGLALIIVGLAFKTSAAPFHMWTPDVYQGAPTPVTAFMSAATKVARSS